MKKLWLALVAISLILSLGACGKNIGGVFPDDWYELTNKMNGKNISWSFELNEPADLTISVTTKKGDMRLGIMDTETNEFVFEMRKFNNTKEVFSLPAGQYELVMDCLNHTGSYTIKKSGD